MQKTNYYFSISTFSEGKALTEFLKDNFSTFNVTQTDYFNAPSQEEIPTSYYFSVDTDSEDLAKKLNEFLKTFANEDTSLTFNITKTDSFNIPSSQEKKRKRKRGEDKDDKKLLLD